MRKLILLFLLLICVSVNAQNHEKNNKPYEVYCQVYGRLQSSGKIEYKRIFWPEFETRSKLTDENGNILEFNNIVDAMNYLGKRGWSYVDNYSYSDMIFYTFKKSVNSDEEAKEGLYFRDDFKKK